MSLEILLQVENHQAILFKEMKTHYWRQCFFPVFSININLKYLSWRRDKFQSKSHLHWVYIIFCFRCMMFVASEFSKSSSENICWGNIWCLPQIWDKNLALNVQSISKWTDFLFVAKLASIKRSSCTVILQKRNSVCIYRDCLTQHNFDKKRMHGKKHKLE